MIIRLKINYRIIFYFIFLTSNILTQGQKLDFRYPIMDVLDYPFMNSISELIKGTDMSSTYPAISFDRSSEIYDIYIRSHDGSVPYDTFTKDGDYNISIKPKPIMADDIEYRIFIINDTYFACDTDLYPYFISCKSKKTKFHVGQFEPPILGGTGCFWHFIIKNGFVVAAVYQCFDDNISDKDIRLYDLLLKRQLTVKEYNSLYPTMPY